MDIVLYCPGMPFHGGSLEEGQSLGGSESAGFYLARELSRLGHRVTVFTGIGPDAAGIWDGVRYLSAGPATPETPLGADFEWYMATTPHDLLILQRVPDGFARPCAAKVHLWWSHDLALKRHLPGMARQLWNVDRVLAVSEFHRQQIARVYGLGLEQIAVAPNGIDPALFEPVRRAAERDPAGLAERKWSGGRMVYSSRPERGLELLVAPGGVMDRLAEAAPELTLQVAGYDNTTERMRPLYERLWARCEALPNVEWLGARSKKELADLMAAAWLHLYPTTFEEVSCITAMEAQAAGNPVVTSSLAALPETLADGGAVWLAPEPEGLVRGAVDTVTRLRGDRAEWERLHRRALAKAPAYDWRPTAERVVELAEGVLRERSAAPRRLARHLIRHSDVMACRLLAEREPAEGDTGPAPLDAAPREELARHYGFVATGDYAGHYERMARWQAERGQDHGLGDPERVLAMPRFAVVAERVAALPAGATVLDYACGQGHLTCALAARHPRLRFVGVDIAPSNVTAGAAHARTSGLENVRFLAGEADAAEGPFDLVLACEVMEHVPEPGALADALEARLTPGGELCVTVPYGPWEAESYATEPFRTHIHHLERANLRELWGHKPEYAVLAVPVRATEQGEPLGCYRVTWRAGGTPSGTIDLGRKLATQAPRETVSVCVICQPDGSTLARTLESVQPVCDQLVIGIDGAEEGRGPAWGIADRYGAEAFRVPSPLTVGFDAARNLALARAWGDWVLWIDDDEVLEWPERLAKYLRPNGYAAYAVKQHHYSVEPEGVLKTDFPCRLFRNRPGIRFYGLVHEHPETELNRGLGPVLLLPDVAICHAGYDTEATRRRRFRRNLPLMVRDRELYPERLLGKFLWIRDLAHLNRYAREAGQGPGLEHFGNAEQAVALWRELLEAGQVRMAVDALPYYSEAVQTLTGGGIDFALGMGAACGGIGDLNDQPPPALRGRFLDPEDIRHITEAVLEEKTAPFREKYF